MSTSYGSTHRPAQNAVRPPEPDLKPISLDDDDEPSQPQPVPVEEDKIDLAEGGPTESKIRAFGVAGVARHKEWSRQTSVTGKGACRVRSFHGKLSDQGMTYLDDSINEWLDHHPEVEVKFVTSSIGTFEGKIREPAIILNLWY